MDKSDLKFRCLVMAKTIFSDRSVPFKKEDLIKLAQELYEWVIK